MDAGIVVFIFVAASGFLILWFLPLPLSGPGFALFAGNLADHDLSDLLPGPTATKWRHSYVCTECHSPVGHQEFMTNICLTCGRQMSLMPNSRAFRRVTRHGKWVRHQSPTNLLEYSKGRWMSPKEYDALVTKQKTEISDA